MLEYCGLPRAAIPIATFHVDHIKAKQHEGSDDPTNLALACGHCNRRKGTNLSGIDPETGEIVPLFQPSHRCPPNTSTSATASS